VKVIGRAEAKSTKMTFFDNGKDILDEKISLIVSGLLVSPACMAGCPDLPSILQARWGLAKLYKSSTQNS